MTPSKALITTHLQKCCILKLKYQIADNANIHLRYHDGHSLINFVLSCFQLYCIEATSAIVHYYVVFENDAADGNRERERERIYLILLCAPTQ